MPNTETIRDKAMALLARREYSRQELYRKLSQQDIDRAELEMLLDELTTRGWLSDLRFAHAYVETYANRFGRYRLENELRERGIADDVIQTAMAEIPPVESELSRAKAVWQKKFRTLPQDADERARQARFLQSRGFAYDTIRRVLSVSDNE
ncbi:recombination regulator RecX [Chitinimonas sp. PSY-7]|uniref:recombination regulator RecX n=1 Tax=Chitinimonas sp. PSY-7 TaxID=3459088 RepID=UPI00403FD6AF